MEQLVQAVDMQGVIKLALHDNKKQDFNSISTEYQEFYFQKLLGDELYNEFDSGLAEVTPNQKWLDLRDGADFTTSDGKALKWLGLKNMLKFIIYYEYKKDNRSVDTISGETKKQNLHSIYANENAKLQKAYNKAVDLYGLDFAGIAINNDIIGGYYLNNRINCLYSRGSNTKSKDSLLHQATFKPSAYNFILSKNKEDENTYPNWEFTKISHLTW